MKDRLFLAIRKPIDKITDDCIRSIRKVVQAVNQLPPGTPIVFEDGGNVDLKGKFKVTKEGQFLFAGGVSGTIPVEGVPVDVDVDSEFNKEWDVRNSGQLEIAYYIRFQLGEVKK